MSEGLLSRVFRFRRKEPAARRKPKISLIEIIDYMAFAYFGKYAPRVAAMFELERNLRMAGITTNPLMYASRLLFVTAAAAFLAIYFGVIVALLPISLIAKVITIILLALAPVIVFAFTLSYPSMKVSSRKMGVDSELPFFAAYLTTMVRGGATVERVLLRVARLRVFKAIREEARRILRDMEFFGRDPLTAIEHNAIEHPSPKYRDFMLGYVTTVRTGGDVLHYLEIRTQDIFTSRISELKAIADRMGMFVEMYITIAVIATLMLYIFFTISAIFPTGGKYAGYTQLALYSFVFLPLITIFMGYLIHASQPRSPIPYKSPYRALLLVGIPAAIVTFPVTFYAFGGYKILIEQTITKNIILGLTGSLTATLIALSLPSALTYLREKRRERGLAKATASFLRDLAETRKTGLSPERSIEHLALTRNYGPLSRILRRVAAALTLGMDVEAALRRALRGIKDWVLLTTMRFLVDSIEVGGGSPETLDTLARYAHSLVELDEEMRRKLRMHIVMPYMGAVMVAASSLMVLGYLGQTLTVTTPGQTALMPQAGNITQSLPQIALVLSMGSVFNAWLMGLLAGKIQDTRLAAGFLHGIILTIIALIATLLTMAKIYVPT